MIGELILLALFSSILVFQLNRIRKLVARDKRTIGTQMIMISGIFLIIGMTIWLGDGSFHYLIGVVCSLVLFFSLHVFGLTKDSVIYYSSSYVSGRGISIRRFIGEEEKVSNQKNVRIVENSQDSVDVKFSAKNTEQVLKFSRDDFDEIKELLDLNNVG